MTRHNPVRWVCQCKPEACKGVFFVHGQGTSCPLWPRCSGPGHGAQLEYLYPQRDGHQVRITVADPEHKAQHAKRIKALMRAFRPDKVKTQQRRQYERARDREAAIRARKYREEHLPGTEQPKITVPPAPCGGDCANCPWDDCRYPTWETDWLDQQGLALTGDRKTRHRVRNNAAAKARRAAETPEEREARLAKNRAYYRARCVDIPAEEREALRAARSEQYHAERAAETPEEREARLAKGRERNRRWRAKETPEHKEARLAKDRARSKAKLETETPEEREARLAKQRANYWAAHDNRLAWKRAYYQAQKANGKEANHEG